ncbi:MAG: sigma-70 family RNA polymerase sigma factor, partial [Bacteroidetes bacterium]|nr:sigma-70 family RNA polymerase sigma factor [Bacteroidota bacterium]
LFLGELSISWAIHHHQVSVEEAKDVFQESVIALYKNVKADKLESLEVPIKTYLFGIGKNIILNTIKRRNIAEKVFENLNFKNENRIYEHYEHEHLVSLVKRLYRSMGSPCKEILEMFYEKGFDMESIASRVGYKNADVAKKKKYECLSHLENRISKSRIKEMLN